MRIYRFGINLIFTSVIISAGMVLIKKLIMLCCWEYLEPHARDREEILLGNVDPLVVGVGNGDAVSTLRLNRPPVELSKASAGPAVRTAAPSGRRASAASLAPIAPSAGEEGREQG